MVETGKVDFVAEGRVCERGAEACLEKVLLSKRGYTGRERNDLQQPEARLGLVTIRVLEPEHKRE